MLPACGRGGTRVDGTTPVSCQQPRATLVLLPVQRRRASPCTVPGAAGVKASPYRCTKAAPENTLVFRKQRLVVTRSATQQVEAAVAGGSGWWTQNPELWIDVRTEEEFKREVLDSTQPVCVDFFATWCSGCQKSFPEVCKVVTDAGLRQHYKFVKVCVDDLKVLAKEENITALPRMNVYRPNEGRVATIDVPFSKVKHLKHNLQIIMHNPDKAFAADPNGFMIPVDATGHREKEKAKAAARAAEAAKLASSQSGLFEHLMSVARGEAPSPAAPSSASGPASSNGSAAAAAAASSVASGGSTDGSSSGGEAGPGRSDMVEQYTSPQQVITPISAPFGGDHAYMLDKVLFMKRHPDYGYDGLIDTLYPAEVGVRMRPEEHYMDYTGSGVYCQSQLNAVFEELRSHMFGNPHSANPSSALTSDRVDAVRSMVLKFFNADPREYQLVFTRSATGALKMVGETFPWTEGSVFRYLRENHNSVLGVREYALKHGSTFEAVDETFVRQWVAAPPETHGLDHLPAAHAAHDPDSGSDTEGARLAAAAATVAANEPTYSLFAFPAEDNFAGVKYPLSWVSAVRSRSTSAHRWLVLLDAAAYVPTQPLDLTMTPVDFVDMSFYKMFGYPTGVGALIVRTDAIPLLRKVFWGGGTVALATSEDNFHVLKCRPSDKLEDGTVAFLDIMSLKHGFQVLERLGGMSKIQAHVAALTQWLYQRLSQLRHSNGRPLLAIFGKHHLPESREVQGGILNFEVLRPDGSIVSYRTVEREAAAAGFHVRAGSQCNPGACYNHLGLRESEVEALAGIKEGCQDSVDFVTVERPAVPRKEVKSSDVLRSIGNSAIALGHPGEVALKWVQVPLGSVRASLGCMSTFEDVYAFAKFLEAKYTDRTD